MIWQAVARAVADNRPEVMGLLLRPVARGGCGIDLDLIEFPDDVFRRHDYDIFKNANANENDGYDSPDDGSDDEWGGGQVVRVPKVPIPEGDASRSYFLWRFVLAPLIGAREDYGGERSWEWDWAWLGPKFEPERWVYSSRERRRAKTMFQWNNAVDMMIEIVTSVHGAFATDAETREDGQRLLDKFLPVHIRTVMTAVDQREQITTQQIKDEFGLNKLQLKQLQQFFEAAGNYNSMFSEDSEGLQLSALGFLDLVTSIWVDGHRATVAEEAVVDN